jgi:hypothetical protein
MRILSIYWVLIIFLLLHLVLPSTLFCHHRASWDLHVVNNELKGEEGVLLVLTGKILDGDQHILYLL